MIAVTSTTYTDQYGRQYEQVTKDTVADALTAQVYLVYRAKWRRYIIKDSKGVLLTEIV